MPDRDDETSKSYGEGWSYVTLGFTFAFAILAFGALGWLIDGWLHTLPLFAIAGGFFGGFAGFMRIYYAVQRSTGDGKTTRNGERGTRNSKGS